MKSINGAIGPIKTIMWRGSQAANSLLKPPRDKVSTPNVGLEREGLNKTGVGKSGFREYDLNEVSSLSGILRNAYQITF